jgi:ABC-2 type transport system ATP-binding protein
MTIVIKTEQLTRRFGEHTAVRDLTMTVEAGEIFGFLGHNGAGKTTTVRLLNGLLEPNGGSLQVLGYDPVTQGARLRRITGVLTETPSLDERLSAIENLSLFAAMYGVPRAEIPKRVQELLELFGLADRGRDRVSGYSKGMKQRLALARALVHQPQLIFLDEPASGLDPVVTRQLHDLILRLSREEGKTIFLCTHNLNEAQKLCRRVAVLQTGRLVALGTPRELARQVRADIHLSITVDPTQVASAIAALTPTHAADVTVNDDGNTLHLAGVTHEQIPVLVSTLVTAGTRIFRVEHEEPSLEDIYFALHVPTERPA